MLAFDTYSSISIEILTDLPTIVFVIIDGLYWDSNTVHSVKILWVIKLANCSMDNNFLECIDNMYIHCYYTTYVDMPLWHVIVYSV